MSHADPSRAADVVLFMLALSVFAWLFYADAQPQSPVRDTLSTALWGPEPSLLRGWRECDALIASVAPPQGNLVGDFRPLAVADNRPVSLASALYCRSVYTLWPQRIFAAEPGTIINTSADLAAATPPSDPAWLAAHDVRAQLTFGRTLNHPVLLQRNLIP